MKFHQMLVSPNVSATYARRNDNTFPCFTTPNHQKVNSSHQQSNFDQDNWFNLINMFLNKLLQHFVAFIIIITMSNIVPGSKATNWKGVLSVQFDALHNKQQRTGTQSPVSKSLHLD